MSKEIWDFEGENGSSAYIAGVVDVLSDRLCMVCDYGYAFEADIIAMDMEKNNHFSEAVKERLRKYKSMHCSKNWEENISKLDFSLETFRNQNIEGAMYEKFQKVSHGKAVEKEIKEFCDSISWYIGKPKAVYEMREKFEENCYALNEHYLGIITDILFVEYEGFMVMMLWGSVE